MSLRAARFPLLLAAVAVTLLHAESISSRSYGAFEAVECWLADLRSKLQWDRPKVDRLRQATAVLAIRG